MFFPKIKISKDMSFLIYKRSRKNAGKTRPENAEKRGRKTRKNAAGETLKMLPENNLLYKNQTNSSF
jgi:hypothetical protein